MYESSSLLVLAEEERPVQDLSVVFHFTATRKKRGRQVVRQAQTMAVVGSI